MARSNFVGYGGIQAVEYYCMVVVGGIHANLAAMPVGTIVGCIRGVGSIDSLTNFNNKRARRYLSSSL